MLINQLVLIVGWEHFPGASQHRFAQPAMMYYLAIACLVEWQMHASLIDWQVHAFLGEWQMNDWVRGESSSRPGDLLLDSHIRRIDTAVSKYNAECCPSMRHFARVV